MNRSFVLSTRQKRTAQPLYILLSQQWLLYDDDQRPCDSMKFRICEHQNDSMPKTCSPNPKPRPKNTNPKPSARQCRPLRRNLGLRLGHRMRFSRPARESMSHRRAHRCTRSSRRVARDRKRNAPRSPLNQKFSQHAVELTAKKERAYRITANTG